MCSGQRTQKDLHLGVVWKSKNKRHLFKSRCVGRLSERRPTQDAAFGSVQHPKELKGVSRWIPCVLHKTQAHPAFNDLESIFGYIGCFWLDFLLSLGLDLGLGLVQDKTQVQAWFWTRLGFRLSLGIRLGIRIWLGFKLGFWIGFWIGFGFWTRLGFGFSEQVRATTTEHILGRKPPTKDYKIGVSTP